MAAQTNLLDDVDLSNLPSSSVNQSINRGYQSSSDDFVEINADFDDFVSGEVGRRTSTGSESAIRKLSRQTSSEEKPKPIERGAKFLKSERSEVISLIYDNNDAKTSKSDLIDDSDDDLCHSPTAVDSKVSRPLLTGEVTISSLV